MVCCWDRGRNHVDSAGVSPQDSADMGLYGLFVGAGIGLIAISLVRDSAR